MMKVVAPVLCKLIPRLGSNHPGEVIATAAAIERMPRSAGCDWHDLANALADAQDWRETLAFCAVHLDRLTRREREFLTSLAHWGGDLTEKQGRRLEAIAARVRART
jgi:hypothetical protein